MVLNVWCPGVWSNTNKFEKWTKNMIEDLYVIELWKIDKIGNVMSHYCHVMCNVPQNTRLIYQATNPK